jgi:hypothetical protein
MVLLQTRMVALIGYLIQLREKILDLMILLHQSMQ